MASGTASLLMARSCASCGCGDAVAKSKDCTSCKRLWSRWQRKFKEWHKPYFISGFFKWGDRLTVREVMRQMHKGSFDPSGSYFEDYNAKYIEWASSNGKPLRAMARSRSRSRSR